jgi:signal transduction histidine kinase
VIVVILALFRLMQHLPYIAVVIASGGWLTYAHPAFAGWFFAASFTWSFVLLARAYLRRGLTWPWAVTDVAFYIVALTVIGRESLPGHAGAWDNWSVGPAVGAGIVATVYLGRAAYVCVPALAVAYLVGVAPLVATSDYVGVAVGSTAVILMLPGAAGLAVSALRRSAHAARVATHKEYELRLERDTERRLFDERTRQYALLHDTVLSTLSAIARGGLDHRATEVQKRCADDADLLRGLITGMSHDTPTSLATALAEVSRAHAELGLEVRQQYDTLPDGLPPQAIEAIVLAVREALNNVSKHAKTVEAWVTATGDESGAVRVTVADRGVGFRVAPAHGGFGITRSIRGRLHDVGGRANIHSWEGEGTEVEIEWPDPDAFSPETAEERREVAG